MVPTTVCPPKAGKDRHSMSRDTDKSFFISSPLANKYAGLYQQLLSGVVSYKELGNRIIRRIKAAHAFRQVEQVRELSGALINIPIKECQLIAQYYLVWCECRESKLNADALESIADQSRTYKAKAFLSLAGFAELRGDFELELFFLNESLKAKPGVSDYIQAIRATAIVKAIEGFHASSLKDMETLLPFIRHAEPLAYYDFLNSYAVGLNEIGRKNEARNVIRHVVASPFAYAYPEWQETAQELKEPSRVYISMPHVEDNPIEVEAKVSRHASKEAIASRPAKVVAFPPLKEAPPPKKPEVIGSRQFADMSLADKREFILAAVKTELLPETEYNKMVLMLGLVKSDAAPNVIDLEDEKVLNDLMIEWAHLIEPDELAGVLSALRDCEDDQRRTTIIDKMIRKVFEYSRVCNITESDWRLQVERRLPEK
jgi:hypothetical protein